MTDPLRLADPPYVEITRVGRWRYSIAVHHGILRIGPGGGHWYRYGRRRAETKARRELDRYRLGQEPRDTWTIE